MTGINEEPLEERFEAIANKRDDSSWAEIIERSRLSPTRSYRIPRHRRRFVLVACAFALITAGSATAIAVHLTKAKCVGAGCEAAKSSLVPLSTVNCASTTVTSPFPVPRSVYREVLGAVLVPLRYQPKADITASPNKQWPFSMKMVIFIHQRTRPVLASIPKRLRSHVAMMWGTTPPSSAVRFTSCSTTGLGADGWTGSLFLKSRSPLCVPILFSIGRRHESVPFGIGRHC